MATFPTLSAKPVASAWKENRVMDPTIRDEVEGGYVITGTRFTRIPPKKYHVKVAPVTEAEKALLEALEEEVFVGAGMFDWTNPITEATVDARLGKGGFTFGLYEKLPECYTVEFDIEVV